LSIVLVDQSVLLALSSPDSAPFSANCIDDSEKVLDFSALQSSNLSSIPSIVESIGIEIPDISVTINQCE